MSRRMSRGDSACPISLVSSVNKPSAIASDSAGSRVEKFPVLHRFLITHFYFFLKVDAIPGQYDHIVSTASPMASQKKGLWKHDVALSLESLLGFGFGFHCCESEVFAERGESCFRLAYTEATRKRMSNRSRDREMIRPCGPETNQ